MLELIQFQADHILEIRPRYMDQELASALDDWRKMAHSHKQNGPSFTALWNGVPMFCAGLLIPWTGLAEGWAFTSDLVTQHPIAFHRAVRNGLENLIETYKLRRLQVAIPKDHDVSCRWIQTLGFRRESKMPAYGPFGDTYLRFVRLV